MDARIFSCIVYVFASIMWYLDGANGMLQPVPILIWWPSSRPSGGGGVVMTGATSPTPAKGGLEACLADSVSSGSYRQI